MKAKETFSEKSDYVSVFAEKMLLLLYLKKKSKNKKKKKWIASKSLLTVALLFFSVTFGGICYRETVELKSSH